MSDATEEGRSLRDKGGERLVRTTTAIEENDHIILFDVEDRFTGDGGAALAAVGRLQRQCDCSFSFHEPLRAIQRSEGGDSKTHVEQKERWEESLWWSLRAGLIDANSVKLTWPLKMISSPGGKAYLFHNA
ncbi:unnamed protein product, partial [Sphenostylis stenocarpa]